MYDYDSHMLNEQGKTRVYLITFLEHPDKESRNTKMLIPEAYKMESRAIRRSKETNNAAKKGIKASKCTVGMKAYDKEKEKLEDLHIVLFREHDGPRNKMAELHTPEILMSPKSATERKQEINNAEGRNMEAQVWPLELYSDKNKIPQGVMA